MCLYFQKSILSICLSCSVADDGLLRLRGTVRMPTAAVIRAYLEEHGIQAALNAAVNAALQVQAPNALEFIGDWLIKKAAESGGAPASTRTRRRIRRQRSFRMLQPLQACRKRSLRRQR